MIEKNLGERLTALASQQVAGDVDTFGDPAAAMIKKIKLLQVLLEVSGVTQGKPLTPATMVAIDALSAVAGLVTAVKPGPALARYIATGVAAAPLIDLAERTDLKMRLEAEADKLEAEAARAMAEKLAPKKQEEVR